MSADLWVALIVYVIAPGAFITGLAAGGGVQQRQDADCHIGALDNEEWRKAVALAELRAAEKKRKGNCNG